MDSEQASRIAAETQQAARKKGTAGKLITGIVLLLLTIVCIAAAIFLPVLQVTGDAMAPTLQSGCLVLTVKGGGYSPGDVVAVQVNGKFVVRRVISAGNENVIIGADGSVTVGNRKLDEPYVKNNVSTGVEETYLVPAGQLFLLGDDRAESVDSRHEAMGCVPQQKVFGKVLMCFWPIKNLSLF